MVLLFLTAVFMHLLKCDLQSVANVFDTFEVNRKKQIKINHHHHIRIKKSQILYTQVKV